MHHNFILKNHTFWYSIKVMEYVLFWLFGSAFLAATVLPAQSELLLASLVVKGEHDFALLIAVATAGNVLGSFVNYYIGAYLMHFKDHKYFPIKKNILKKGEKTYTKYGALSLLFAWLPIVGDALTVIAGMFKTKLWLFALLVTVGKSIRYIIVALLAG